MGLHVIFGTGPVGLSVARELLGSGEKVRMVNRSGELSTLRKSALAGVKLDSLELVAAQAMHMGEVQKAAQGASVIYHCINPLYHQWAEILPVVQSHLVQAAVENQAVLAVSENLYMYQRGVKEINQDTPIDPPTKKGRIRQELHQSLVTAGENQGLKWTSVRASDFYGPGSTDQSVFGTKYFLEPLNQGKDLSLMGDPDQEHTYTYVRDFGRALVLAAKTPEALGRSWILGADLTETTREFAKRWLQKIGANPKIKKLPELLIKFLGIFNPVMRELPEMLYQKNEPYRVSSRALVKELGFELTSTDQAIAETLEWYKGLSKQPLEVAS